MNEVINTIIAIIFSGAIFFGAGVGIKTIHDKIKKETLTQISKGLSSTEKLANALTGEKLD